MAVAWAMDWDEAPLMVALDSARGWLLCTLALADGATDGERDALAPAALAVLWVRALGAEAEDAAALGVLRAAFMLAADWAMDCAEAICMVWLFSARACPAITEALAAVEDGEKELLAPATLGELAAAALLGAAEADWAEADCGSLRVAFMLEAACDADCDEEAAAMGVSRMESRISLLISCTAESSPLREMVNCCSLRPALRLPSMNQFFW